MKNLKKSLFFALLLICTVSISLTSCNNDDDVKSTTDLIVANKWTLKGITATTPNTNFTVETQFLLALSTSIREFKTDGTYTTVITVPLMGELGNSSLSGKWSLSTDNKKITMDGVVSDIKTITADKFEIVMTPANFYTMIYNAGNSEDDNTDAPDLTVGNVTVTMEVAK